MDLKQLIYTSSALPQVKTEDIEAIWEHASANNKKYNITGVLLFNKFKFVQILEGDAVAISNLYHLISRDERHHKLLIIGCQDIVERDFPFWSMGYIAEIMVNKSIILKYSADEEFEPERMKYESLRRMLIQLSASKLNMT
ncbi:BLUF domain-containing protein [Legionella erythra]|uniref:Regulatory protein (GGDEF domain) n=1 Tax=Legionella erythra TaxID=448 RepID=A0A0W0TQ91_LEGER|nr:BLUF domain-containing protein [Legionella erythra]KTC97811.1 regulatory protein (GGDEF domain) [Legionella erythra]